MPEASAEARVEPGQDGRASYLNKLLKELLRDELDIVDLELLTARGEAVGHHQRAEAAQAKVAGLEAEVAELQGAAEQLAQVTLRVGDLEAEVAAKVAEMQRLAAEAEKLEAEAGEAARLTLAVRRELADLRAARESVAGLTPMVLHVGGVEWNGTDRSLIRCAASGELAESWMVKIGTRTFTTSGQGMEYRPYRHIGESLRPKVRWTLEEGLAFLRKHRV